MRLLIVALFLWVTPADAAKITVSLPRAGEMLAIVLLEGTFASGDFEALQFQVANVPKAVVLLQSDGGSLMEGIQIGRLIRLRGYITLVPDGIRCASACAIAWLGGVERYMGKAAYVGFHAASRHESGRTIETGAGNALLGAYLSQIGLGESAIFYITKARPAEMTWLTAADAERYGIQVKLFPGEQRTIDHVPSQPTTPSFPPVTEEQPLEQRTRQFISTIFAQLSVASLNVSEFVAGIYDDTADYYGKHASQQDLITDKREFVQRWPLRRYVLRQASLQVRCISETTCAATALSDWATFNPTTMRGARGLAEVQYAISWKSQQPRVFRESGKVISRSSRTSPPKQAGTGWWVIMGAYNEPGGSGASHISNDVRWAMGRAYVCGVDSFHDLSNSFVGFSPGYRVVVAGPFAQRHDAVTVQDLVKDCIPNVYMKQGTRQGGLGFGIPWNA